MGGYKKELKGLGIAIAITLISFLAVFKISGRDITTLFEARAEYIAVSLTLHFLFWIFWALRLEFIANMLGGKMKFGTAFLITLASNFFAAVTPSSAGGEPIRVFYLSKNGIMTGRATAVVLIERLVDSIFFVVFLTTLLLITDFSLKLGFKVGGIFLTFLVLFVLALYELFKYPDRVRSLLSLLEERISEKIYKKIEREVWNFREALVDLLKNSKRIPVLFILTALIWIPEFLIPSFVLLAFSSNPYFLLSLTAQAIIVVVSLIPLTPGSSGIAEGSFFYLYSQFVEGNLAPVVAVWRTITYISNIVSGVFSLALLRSRQD